MGIRVTPELREELVKRAEAKGRSITQEIEFLLEYGRIAESMFSGDLRDANMTMTATFEHAGKAAARGTESKGAWLSDPRCFRFALEQMIIAMLDAGPDGLSLKSTEALFEGIRRHLISKANSGFLSEDEANPTLRQRAEQ